MERLQAGAAVLPSTERLLCLPSFSALLNPLKGAKSEVEGADSEAEEAILQSEEASEVKRVLVKVKRLPRMDLSRNVSYADIFS